MKIRMIFRAVPAAVLIAAMGGCDQGLTELNENPNQPVSVGAEFLLPAAIVAGAERLHGSSLNMDMVGLWVQHYAEHRYTQEGRYEIMESTVNSHWDNLYESPLRDLYEVVEKGKENERPNVQAVGTILKAWVMQAVTDIWGDAGYSKALLGRNSPPDMTVAYDTQEDIYNGLLAELSGAISMISPSGPRISDGDLLYGGDMDQWRLFANSLRLRMAMRLSEVDPSLAAAEVANAISAGVFTSSDDDAVLHFLDNGVDVHPIFGYERNRDDHSISATLVDSLKSFNDPRLPVYARPNQAGEYVGTAHGDMTDPPLAQVSRIGTWFSSAATRRHPVLRRGALPQSRGGRTGLGPGQRRGSLRRSCRHHHDGRGHSRRRHRRLSGPAQGPVSGWPGRLESDLVPEMDLPLRKRARSVRRVAADRRSSPGAGSRCHQ